MSVLPLSSPKFRAFDSSGDPLAGGKLYAYAAGTTTPLDTYTTRAGTIANANPVVLDGNGEADVWTTPGVLYKFVLKDSSDVTQWTVDNVPSGSGETSATDISSAVDPGGRLTLSTGIPVTTSNVTGATTVHYTPHKHNRVPLYDGSTWTLSTFTELSQTLSDTTKSPAAAASDGVYDLFIWDDSGTLRLSRGPAWSSETVRGGGAGSTDLVRVDGRYVNQYAISNGPAAQCGLYIGTIRVNSSGELEDSLTSRNVWNAYQRTKRALGATDPATTWTYETDTWRQANGNTDNQFDFVLGFDEEPVRADVLVVAEFSLVGATGAHTAHPRVGLGLDSTTVNSASVSASVKAFIRVVDTNSHEQHIPLTATYEGNPGKGRHRLNWLERAALPLTGTVTWYGQGGVAVANSGMTGHIFA